MYTRTTNFEGMSSTAWSGASFENQHNEIHVAVGGIHPVGHLADFPYSGFDPVFMLHHCAIDRHIALWQAIHYNVSMFRTTYVSEVGAYATSPGTNISADSPLKPFHADGTGRFHTSNSVRDVRALGYTYPELVGQHGLTPEQLRKQVSSAITTLYGPGLNAITKRSLGTASKEYFASITIDKAEVELPAIVNLFVGQQLAGRLILPRVPNQSIVHEEIPLENALSGNSLEGRGAEIVIPYLEKLFHWEIKKVSGETDTTTYLKYSLWPRFLTEKKV